MAKQSVYVRTITDMKRGGYRMVMTVVCGKGPNFLGNLLLLSPD